jgi:hypothetical protein
MTCNNHERYNAAIQSRIQSAVDFAHASRTQRTHDLIRT